MSFFLRQQNYKYYIRYIDNIPYIYYSLGPTTSDVVIFLSSRSIYENRPINTTIGFLSTSDIINDYIFTLVGGTGSADNSSFSITGNSLISLVQFNYSIKNTYSIRIRATKLDGDYTEQILIINILNINDAPTSIDLSSSSVDENKPPNTFIGTFYTNDPDLNSNFTYSLVGGVGAVDNNLFNINDNSLRTSTIFNYEAQNSYSIRVRSTDPGGLYVEESFTISIVNINETPTDISLSLMSIDENKSINTTIGTFSISDVDSGDTFTYSLVSGTGSSGNSAFTVDDNVLKSAVIFDYETQNSYSIRVRSTDAGGLYFEKTFTILVNDINEAPTDISLDSASLNENEPIDTVIGSFSTIDPDIGDTFTYSLVSGTGSSGNSAFTVDDNVLKSAVIFDYETQNSYSIRVRSTDAGGLYFEKTFTILVNDININQNPTDISLSSISIDEDESIDTVIGSFSTVDPDAGDTFTYSLVSGTGSSGNSAFTVDDNVLKSAVIFDYETQNSYSIRVRSTDAGGLYFEKTFTITINDINEAPTDISLSSISVYENLPVDNVIGTFSTIDPDIGDAFIYSLVSGDGSDNNSEFTIDNNILKTAAVFDYITKNSYSIRVRSTDIGGLYFEKIFNISIIDANEAPTDILLYPSEIYELQPTNTTIGLFTTIDNNSTDTFTYSLVSGYGDEDNIKYIIENNSLKVNYVQHWSWAVSIYNENPPYKFDRIRVRSTDTNGLYFEQTFDVKIKFRQISLFPQEINEATPASYFFPSTVGSFSVIGAPGINFTYTFDRNLLYNGCPNTQSRDNELFLIDGSTLKTPYTFIHEARTIRPEQICYNQSDYPNKYTYYIQVKAQDPNTYEGLFSTPGENTPDDYYSEDYNPLVYQEFIITVNDLYQCRTLTFPCVNIGFFTGQSWNENNCPDGVNGVHNHNLSINNYFWPQIKPPPSYAQNFLCNPWQPYDLSLSNKIKITVEDDVFGGVYVFDFAPGQGDASLDSANWVFNVAESSHGLSTYIHPESSYNNKLLVSLNDYTPANTIGYPGYLDLKISYDKNYYTYGAELLEEGFAFPAQFVFTAVEPPCPCIGNLGYFSYPVKTSKSSSRLAIGFNLPLRWRGAYKDWIVVDKIPHSIPSKSNINYIIGNAFNNGEGYYYSPDNDYNYPNNSIKIKDTESYEPGSVNTKTTGFISISQSPLGYDGISPICTGTNDIGFAFRVDAADNYYQTNVADAPYFGENETYLSNPGYHKVPLAYIDGQGIPGIGRLNVFNKYPIYFSDTINGSSNEGQWVDDRPFFGSKIPVKATIEFTNSCRPPLLCVDIQAETVTPVRSSGAGCFKFNNSRIYIDYLCGPYSTSFPQDSHWIDSNITSTQIIYSGSPDIIPMVFENDNRWFANGNDYRYINGYYFYDLYINNNTSENIATNIPYTGYLPSQIRSFLTQRFYAVSGNNVGGEWFANSYANKYTSLDLHWNIDYQNHTAKVYVIADDNDDLKWDNPIILVSGAGSALFNGRYEVPGFSNSIVPDFYQKRTVNGWENAFIIFANYYPSNYYPGNENSDRTIWSMGYFEESQFWVPYYTHSGVSLNAPLSINTNLNSTQINWTIDSSLGTGPCDSGLYPPPSSTIYYKNWLIPLGSF